MNMQVDSPTTVALAQTKPLVPGYLFTPFGWAARPLAMMIQSEPGLLTHVFELDRPRMHVIALALAHLMKVRHQTLRRSYSVAQSTRFSTGLWADRPPESDGCYAACRSLVEQEGTNG